MEALCAQYRRERTNLACMSCFSTRSANVSLSQIRYILNAWYIDTFAGGHLGRDKTLEKICSRFYLGRGMAEEIKEFVRTCDKCQRVNDKFHKPTAVLHPIPVTPEVWNQVPDSIYKPLGSVFTYYVL